MDLIPLGVGILIAAAAASIVAWVSGWRRAAGGILLLVVGCLSSAVIWMVGQPVDFEPSTPAPSQPSASAPAPKAPKELSLPDLRPSDLVDHRPLERVGEGYVSSRECADCHRREHATWHASYHRTMTQVATPKTVQGVFDGQPREIGGRRYRPLRQGDSFWIEMDAPDTPGRAARQVQSPVVLVTGSHHMQVYWYATGRGRLLGQVPIVYLLEERQWVPRNAAFLTPPQAGFHSELGRWNASCVYCHATLGRSRPRADRTMDTHVAELGIACEACHGPGENHVQFRREQREGQDPIVNPAALSSQRSAQVCGQCHSMTVAHSEQELLQDIEQGMRFRPGDELGATRFVVRRNDAGRRQLEQFFDRIEDYLDRQFWPDGMVRVAGREYAGLLETACHQRGELSCLSCHRLHQAEDDSRPVREWANDLLQPGLESDRACTTCHTDPQYGAAAHTHHAADSAGSRCYNCHMPHTSYGLLKAIRSHRISVPTANESLEARRPNACNLCHLDQTLAWTARYLSDWYGQPIPELPSDQRDVAAGVMWTVVGDAGQRALVAWSMGWEPAQRAAGTHWLPPFLAVLLEDPYDAVRLIAFRSLRTIEGYDNIDFEYVGPVERRQQAIQQVLELWRGNLPPVLGNSTLLLDGAGRLDASRLRVLRGRRDERPVDLAE